MAYGIYRARGYPSRIPSTSWIEWSLSPETRHLRQKILADIAIYRQPYGWAKYERPQEMIRAIANRMKLHHRRRKFRAGAELSQFIAKDIRRDIRVIDASMVDEGFVTAQVRTTNVLYHIKGIEPESHFGTPEILNLDRAWKWGGESWGGYEAERPRVPLLTAGELTGHLAEAFPEATFQSEVINPRYGSWQLRVSLSSKVIEFVWGPLSGFGGIDPDLANDDVFAHCDVYLYSEEAAIIFAKKHLKIKNAEETATSARFSRHP